MRKRMITCLLLVLCMCFTSAGAESLSNDVLPGGEAVASESRTAPLSLTTPVPTPAHTTEQTPEPTPKPTPEPTPVPQTLYGGTSAFYIDLELTEAQLFVKGTLRLKPKTVALTDAAPKRETYRWSSSDESVAKVSGDGMITGVSSGTAVVTCTAKSDESVYSFIYVSVVVPVAKLTLNSPSVTLLVGAQKSGLDETRLAATVLPEDAFYRGVTWASSNPEIADVDEQGNVRAFRRGSVTITATSAEEGTARPKKTTCKITVTNAVSEITDEATSLTLNIKKKASLKPKVLPSDAGNKKLSWQSSDESVATVSASGSVTAINEGSCIITGTAQDGSDVRIYYSITVIRPVTKLTSGIKTLRTAVGDSPYIDVFMTVYPYDATIQRLTWTSSDPSVAVEQDGALYVKKVGKCVIKATTTDGSNKSASFNVIVEPPDGTATLYFKDNAYGQWRFYSGDRLGIHFQVTNMETAKTVNAFELYVYALDVWGNRIYGENQVYYWTTTRKVAGGKTVYSDYVSLPNRSEIYKVYCGIHKISYEDGSVVTVRDVDYLYWIID